MEQTAFLLQFQKLCSAMTVHSALTNPDRIWSGLDNRNVPLIQKVFFPFGCFGQSRELPPNEG